MQPRQAHWLRENKAARVPRRLVCFDSEAVCDRQRMQEIQTFRCAAATFDRLDVDARPTSETALLETDDPGELWRWITSCTAGSHRTVAFAHNLAYDLRLTGALDHLPALGFDCKGIALTSYSCWARFHDGKRSLWLCDSLSCLPAPLERVAQLMKMSKPRLPDEDATEADWRARCAGDVEVTRAAILRYLQWIHDDDLGDFRLTGAAQSQAAFRHRFLAPRSLLVHADEDALAAERVAAYAGRSEVWRHGKVDGRVYEYDFEAAYAHLAADLELPARLLGEHAPIPWRRLERVMEVRSVLAECVVSTDVPCVPANLDDRIVWPVGRFVTTLWDHELRLARDEGATVEIRRLWLYKRAPVLRSWAEWILDCLDGNGPGADPLLRLTVKDWSRALIGRFGLRYPNLEEMATVPNHDAALRGYWNADTGEQETWLHLGRQLFQQTGVRESDNSAPAIMSAIMSAARVRLWKAMRRAGFDSILYVDTDGFLCTARAHRVLRMVAANGEIPGFRLKGSHLGADLRGPRNIDLGEERRVSGAPRRAERLAPGVYRGEVWESLPGALRRRRASSVVLHERTFNIADRDPRRLHLPQGATAPIRVDCASGDNVTVDLAQPRAGRSRAAVTRRVPSPVA